MRYTSEYYLDMINDSEKLDILTLQEIIMLASVEFYKKYDIHWLSAPITTGTISSPMGPSSDSLPVRILLDGYSTYLADSMQFLLEYGCRFFKNGCWYIMPTFRGEPVDGRHLKQFFHSEAEIAGNLMDVMDLAESYLKFLVAEIQSKFGSKQHLANFIDNKIPRITFNEAVRILNDEGVERHEAWRNITINGERKLMEYFNGPVWVMNYDEMAVPFYQRSINGKAQNADLLLGVGETVGCGERWENDDEILLALKKHSVSPEEYDWYIKMKKEFPMQTSGFGMGIERFLLFVLEKNDIRDMQVFRRFNDGKDKV